jgi:hypothetical protein
MHLQLHRVHIVALHQYESSWELDLYPDPEQIGD